MYSPVTSPDKSLDGVGSNASVAGSSNSKFSSKISKLSRDMSSSFETESGGRSSLFRNSVNVKEKMSNLTNHIQSSLNIISSNIIGDDPNTQHSNTSLLNYTTGSGNNVSNFDYDNSSPRIKLPPPIVYSNTNTTLQSHSGALPPSDIPQSTSTNKTNNNLLASPVLSTVFDRRGSIAKVQSAIHNNPLSAALGLGGGNTQNKEKNNESLDSYNTNHKLEPKYEMSDYKNSQFEQVLNADIVDMNNLRKLAWNGTPAKYRALVWQLLLSYAPANKNRRDTVIAKKRKEYLELIPIYFNISEGDKTSIEIETSRQILKDLPRTCPDSPFFQQEPIQKAMERILFIWSIRHPACGYVQGMDDLLTPILYICIQPYALSVDQDVFRLDVGKIDKNVLRNFEADAYWCFTKLLDNIHDHFMFSQPGLQRMILLLEDLIHRLDTSLYSHFQTESLQYMQFGFRWMNCLLLRELPFQCILRLWDTYLSEQYGGFENFHVYVCAVLLKTFQNEIIKLPYEELLMFLQDLPTKDWKVNDMEPILSQAFILSTLFENAPSHLTM